MPKGRRGSHSPTMSQRPAPPLYFPSLYDRGISSSPLSDFNIWKKLFVPLKAGGVPAGAAAGGRPLPQAPLAPAPLLPPPPPPPGLGPPGLGLHSERPCPPPWPSGLASIPYEPLRFFYSPPPGPEEAASPLTPGPATPRLASSDHPNYGVQQVELATPTALFCSPADKFLKALKDEKLQGLKTRPSGKKSASLPRGAASESESVSAASLGVSA
uniref:Chromosome 11 open reading frame 91 n=1 Tax=Oryctolagus cuniculus TaxID=9986 RepID=G1U9B6_RABIT